MTRRTYGQHCGLAHALEIVGERWALLIVRDLLVGPKRFTDLRNGLARIPTNVLSARLKELEHAEVVRRRILPRPAVSVVYELTEYGGELEDVVLRLSRWGARTLGEPGPEDVVTVDSLIMAVRSAFRPEAAHGSETSCELRAGEIAIHLTVGGGRLKVAEGALSGADLVIETDSPAQALTAMGTGLAEAVAGGDARLTGDPALLRRFAGAFQH